MVRPDPAPADPPSPRDLIAGQMAMLTRLAQIGMEIAEAAGRRARAEDAPGEHDPSLSYSRAARAVRLTLALQSRLMKDLEALDRADHLARITEASRCRERIGRAVEQVIEREVVDSDETERLSWEARERLSDEDETALLNRPIEEVVAQILHDLGLSPAWGGDAFAKSPSSPGLSEGPKQGSNTGWRGSGPPDEPGDDEPWDLRPPWSPSG